MQERIAVRTSVDAAEIAQAIEQRNAARKAKDFKESDRIRDELLARGIVAQGRTARHDVGGEAVVNLPPVGRSENF